MIGVFDSGYGGLTILRGLVDALPEYSFLYLGDNERAPYGSRSAEEIYECTRQGIEALFSRGCELVILACNTTSANALRRYQQEVLPIRHPGKRVLGILVPTVEQISSDADGAVGVLATEQTVASDAYVAEIHKRNPNVVIYQEPCPDLVPLIESGASEHEIRASVQLHLNQLLRPERSIRTILLGCTHYALIEGVFAELIPPGVKILGQKNIVTQSLKGYLRRHPKLDGRIFAEGKRTFLTTGDPEVVSRLASRFYGEPIQFEHVIIRS